MRDKYINHIINISIMDKRKTKEKQKNRNRKKTMKNSKQNNLKIALLQLLPEKTREENLKKGINACLEAKKRDADIALFPELWDIGYSIPTDKTELEGKAISENEPFVQAFRQTAKKLNMAIAITFLEKHIPSPRNTLCVFDRHGNRILKYSKVHTCDFGNEKNLSAGDGFSTATLDTERGKVIIGAMICFDREFPEAARILMLKGAEIILTSNACPMEINRISQLRARAYENMLAIATANYPKGHPDCNGHSTVFDGIAYSPEKNSSRDTMILDAGENEGIYIAEISLNKLRAYRKSEIHGNAYRRPEKYRELICDKISEPFIREDRRK